MKTKTLEYRLNEALRTGTEIPLSKLSGVRILEYDPHSPITIAQLTVPDRPYHWIADGTIKQGLHHEERHYHVQYKLNDEFKIVETFVPLDYVVKRGEN